MAATAEVLHRPARIAIPAALAIAIAALLAWLVLRPAAVPGITASGTIETVQSDLAAKVQGRLIRLPVRDGQPVRKGQLVALLEQTTPTLSLDQANAAVTAARAAVEEAQAAYTLQQRVYGTQVQQASAGVRIAGAGVAQAGQSLAIEQQASQSQVAQAQSQVDTAQAAFARARIQYERIATLVKTGDASQQSLDDATLQYRSATGQLKHHRRPCRGRHDGDGHHALSG